MSFGLARQEEAYFADRVAKAIYLAPCLYVVNPGLFYYQQIFPELERLGVNNAFEEDWPNKVERVCNEGSDYACNFVTEQLLDIEIAQGVSMKSIGYYFQIAVANRIQEYIPDFGTSSIESQRIPIEKINTVPIQLVVARDDELCTYESAKRMMEEIPAVKTMHTIPGFDHLAFAWNAAPDLIEELVNQIELDPYNSP